MCCECLSDILLVVISVLFPPLPVWIRRGVCSSDSLINICLCILGYLPGLIHSWYIIAKYPPGSYSETHVYYVYETGPDLERQCHGPSHRRHSHTRTQQPGPITGPSYGATSSTPHQAAVNTGSPPAYTEIAK
ncbi:hypothetical protein ACI3LY_005436 [Candidozyma auris]|uniref:Stress response RCI peptide n=1 Tax=Candidozyma auris TaxID=498019 RepID=A0A2H0ZGN6_CANAR|nr:hypothetical protein B9J08_004793 [[Candida] auris]PIS49972.1 hypothetical protein CJI97_004659 [[Candida] auris]PSK79354.1 hypothetical protein CJJ07_000663 [[Candida] auris]GBL51897.1 hypothetical protein CAJCM15448_41710 [[Candida] auris]